MDKEVKVTGIGIMLAFFSGGGRILRKWEMAFLVGLDVLGHYVAYGSFTNGLQAGLILYGVLAALGGIADIKDYMYPSIKTNS